ncbi:hypothetical protein [Chryseobacterium hagamense]|nr:hypothetical protein [Chryseobacterium hagamense]
MPKRKITQSAVKRIQRATTTSNEGVTPKGSFAARAQRIIAKKKK